MVHLTGLKPGQVGVDEELICVERPGRFEHARLSVPYGNMGQQLTNFGLHRTAIARVGSVVEPDSDGARWDRVVLVHVEQLTADPHLRRRIVSEREVPSVHQESTGDGPQAGRRRGDPRLGPGSSADHCGGGDADGTLEQGATAHDLASEMRRPFLVMLGKRLHSSRFGHGANVPSGGRISAMGNRSVTRRSPSVLN